MASMRWVRYLYGCSGMFGAHVAGMLSQRNIFRVATISGGDTVCGDGPMVVYTCTDMSFTLVPYAHYVH